MLQNLHIRSIVPDQTTSAIFLAMDVALLESFLSNSEGSQRKHEEIPDCSLLVAIMSEAAALIDDCRR